MTQLTEVPVVEQLCDDLVEARTKQLTAKIRPSGKQDYFYLSNLHSCTRHMYYVLHDGEKRPPPDAALQALFESGSIWEKEIVRDLLDMGYQWIHGQQVVEIKYHGKVKELQGKTLARGKLDGAIRFKSKEIPTEIKSTDPNKFRRITSIEDLLDDQYCAKWVRQLLFYLYAKAQEEGLFIITDGRGKWMPIPVYLGNHLELAEWTLRNMEKALEANLEGKEPDRIPYNHKVCSKCAFNPICLPSTVIEGGIAIQNDEIEAMLARHEELKGAHGEYEDLHKDVVGLFKGKPQTSVGGRFIVTPKEHVRISYDAKQLTNEQREQIKKETPYWIVEIDDITKKAKDVV